MKIETRDELAAIWLPWYVWADGSGVVEALAAEIENARAVTLGEVALDPQHPVMCVTCIRTRSSARGRTRAASSTTSSSYGLMRLST